MFLIFQWRASSTSIENTFQKKEVTLQNISVETKQDFHSKIICTKLTFLNYCLLSSVLMKFVSDSCILPKETIFFLFRNCYFAPSQPNLGHCQFNSFTHCLTHNLKWFAQVWNGLNTVTRKPRLICWNVWQIQLIIKALNDLFWHWQNTFIVNSFWPMFLILPGVLSGYKIGTLASNGLTTKTFI